MRAYVLTAIRSFLNDPPDSKFQRGYLSALLEVYEESEPGFPIPEDVKRAKALLEATRH